MGVQLAIGAALIFVSICVQSAFIGVIIAVTERVARWAARRPRAVRISAAVGAAALWLSAAHGVAIWIWAAAFVGLGVFATFEASLYFSSVAFTTLGFGDVILPDAWRQLAGLCAANGLLAFGVSAALLVEILRRLWRPSADDDHPTR